MTDAIHRQAMADAMLRVCIALKDQADNLTSLDQAMGDGDLGITLTKIADALTQYAQVTPLADLGKFLGGAGLAANKAGSSTMGTLLATALMRAGKVVMGRAEISATDLAAMFKAADAGMQERGKANLGDKTVLDALHPAAEAFAAAMEQGNSIREAGVKAVQAAEAGRDSVTPLRSKIGRASWVGERTEGKVDPGCATLVVILRALVA
jgi:dihydroxyacetone kinase-like protein